MSLCFLEHSFFLLNVVEKGRATTKGSFFSGMTPDSSLTLLNEISTPITGACA